MNHSNQKKVNAAWNLKKYFLDKKNLEKFTILYNNGARNITYDIRRTIQNKFHHGDKMNARRKRIRKLSIQSKKNEHEQSEYDDNLRRRQLTTAYGPPVGSPASAPPSPSSPAVSDVQSVRLSLSSCIIKVLSLYESSFSVSSSAIASSKACLAN